MSKSISEAFYNAVLLLLGIGGFWAFAWLSGCIDVFLGSGESVVARYQIPIQLLYLSSVVIAMRKDTKQPLRILFRANALIGAPMVYEALRASLDL